MANEDPPADHIVDYEDYPALWEGCFAACFEVDSQTTIPPFMPLLNFFPDEWADASVRLIRQITDSHRDLDGEIVALFKEINWQYHLPAAVATLISPRKAPLLAAAWGAFDRGSWVTPQIAVVAYLADPDFAENAKRRIDQLCPVTSPSDLSEFENHLLRGPANDEQRSAKGINTLLTLGATRTELEQWCRQASTRKDVDELSKQDIDASGHIALSWLERLSARFGLLGLATT